MYGLALGRFYEVDEEAEFASPQGKRGDKGSHPRMRWALMWWVQILESWPPHVFTWKTSKEEVLSDLLTES